ncbi:Rhamnogalacturonyl hydrolase YesR [Parapedobacter composti]|uniref:Rhamnogalacturonyl hydrolase YesR n=1 Tax=Parapedobacter composti TaxID=623281 RepID=A0A1I1E7A6_9SPHI|nr:glycoside hydrolase family 88 protein [Parapedobacter composti]SFB80823.1 Rhamnogalacturonyl hydrolase YesR [Parapedobacter composti]
MMIKSCFLNVSVVVLSIAGCLSSCGGGGTGQKNEVTNDVNTPLHLLKPDYPVFYGETTPDDVKAVLDRIHGYLDDATPVAVINKGSKRPVDDLSSIDTNTIFQQGDFRLISYEWGVTYGAMLTAAESTGDERYRQYTQRRIDFIADVVAAFEALPETAGAAYRSPVHSVTHPGALDDAGSMCAAIIKAHQAGATTKEVRPIVNRYIDYILNKEFRLEDGTLARNRPLPNTLWLDDLYMSLPALAQMAKLTGETTYFDEAIRQFWLFADRMFVAEKGLYMHGWVQDMEPHPHFHWARANGWALLTNVELLSALPDNHPARARLLDQFRAHVRGLAALQDGTGFWHQLLDRNDTYLETSATAIYAYCIAHGINQGWLDAKAYGPMVLQAWNAVSTQVNAQGQVEGTCVGTGMGFDPAFYYHRPVNKYAAHGYGPAILAGAEVYRLLRNKPFEINDSAVMFAD